MHSAKSMAGCSVLVDARALHTSGIGRYLREVLTRLLADVRFSRVDLLGDPEALTAFVAGRAVSGAWRALPYPTAFYSPRAQIAWLVLCTRGGATYDVHFFPHYDAPVLRFPPRSVVTVHDLIHFKVPGVFPARRRVAAGIVFDWVIARAARVIAVSEATRRDVAGRLPVAAGKVVVIPNGVSPSFRPFGPGERIPPGVPPSPFLLCVGNLKPHKNLRAAVEVLAQLRPERAELRLVLAGRPFPGWHAVLRRAEELGVRGAILELGEVSDELLRALYSRCEALLFPSLYEGFGLPALEAMACGAPVVASNRSSIPEVVGNAGLLLDPSDYGGMADALRRLAREPDLRRELVSRGRERARLFGWGRSAERTVDVLYQAARSMSWAPHGQPVGIGR